MAADLTGQEMRAMERYATDAPSEEWDPEFHRRFPSWDARLRAYEVVEHASNWTPEFWVRFFRIQAEAAAARRAPATPAEGGG